MRLPGFLRSNGLQIPSVQRKTLGSIMTKRRKYLQFLERNKKIDELYPVLFLVFITEKERFTERKRKWSFCAECGIDVKYQHDEGRRR